MKKTLATAILSTLALSSVAAAHGRVPGMRMQELDTDGNGTISLDEFKAGVATNLARLDRNADGGIDKAELAERKARPGKKKEVRRAAMAEQSPALANKRVERLEAKKAERQARMSVGFGGIDKNRDGAIDKAEIDTHATETFTKLDTNTDGSIDAGELPTGRGFRGKQHAKKDHTRGKLGKGAAGDGG